MERYLLLAGIFIVAAAVLSFNIEEPTGYAGNMYSSTGTANVGWRVGAGLDVFKENIYTLNTKERRVVVLDPSGKVVLEFGEFGDKDGGFRSPVDVDVDSNGNIYVTDRGKWEILKFGSEGNFLTSFGGRGEEPGTFRDPSGLSVEDDKIYVLDAKARRITTFDLDGNYISMVELPRKES